MDLATREVEAAGITACPNGAWLVQIARNLTAGFLRAKCYLLCDRGGQGLGKDRRAPAAPAVGTLASENLRTDLVWFQNSV